MRKEERESRVLTELTRRALKENALGKVGTHGREPLRRPQIRHDLLHFFLHFLAALQTEQTKTPERETPNTQKCRHPPRARTQRDQEGRDLHTTAAAATTDTRSSSWRLTLRPYHQST